LWNYVNEHAKGIAPAAIRPYLYAIILTKSAEVFVSDNRFAKIAPQG
jgi:hypothetical protein